MANIENINFNLLKSLHALLSLQNVSKAGDKLGISQSAMSINLAILRKHYQDDLLVRGKGGRMQLTSLATQLIEVVSKAMLQAEAVFITSAPFDPSTTTRTYHIGMSDYIAFVLLPVLMKQILVLAPSTKIVQHAINHMDDLKPFDDLNLDIVIGDFQKTPTSLKSTQLFTDKGVIVADKNHPAFRNRQLTLKKMSLYPQVFVTLESQPEENFIAEMLRKMGYEIKISLMTPHTLIALQTLPGTTLMTNTVTRLAKPFLAPLGLSMHDTPYKLRHYNAKMYWHIRDQNDLGHQFIRKLIKEIASSLY